MPRKPTTPIESEDSINEKNTSFLVEQYRVISNNRINHNALFWNFILMFLTAQSFLLILALGGFSQVPWEKAIGGFIGFVFGFMSIQGFERNRVMEIADAELLLDIENHFLNSGKIGLKVHRKPGEYAYLKGDNVLKVLESRGLMTFLNRGISYELWKSGMWLITFVSLTLFFYNMLIYSYVSSTGRFLWYDSFAVFENSFDHSAIGIIIVITAINWIFYIFELLQRRQPKRNQTPDEKVTVADNNQAETLEQSKLKRKKTYGNQKIKFFVYILEYGIILACIIYTLVAYFDHATFIPFMWPCVLLICLAIIVFFHRKELFFFITQKLKKALKKL